MYSCILLDVCCYRIAVHGPMNIKFIVFLVECTVMDEDKKYSVSWVWCVVRILYKWTKLCDMRFFQWFCWRLKVSGTNGCSLTLLHTMCYVHDLLFCFLCSAVRVFCVPVTDCECSGLLLISCKCQLKFWHANKLCTLNWN